MKAHWLSIFQPPAGDGSRLVFDGVQEAETIVHGRLLSGGREVARVANGVVSFTRADNWDSDTINRFRKERLVERNWQSAVSRASQPPSATFCDAMASGRGPILEVAAGPGGGNMPGILHRNADAMLLVNDSSDGVLSLWQQFFDEEGVGSNVCFAAFDATKMPIAANAIAAISNVGGFGNIDIEGGPEMAVQEVSRVLRPGGRVYSFELMISPEDLRNMPAELRRRLSHVPLAGGIGPALEANGLSIEVRQVSYCRMADPEQDGIAKLAQGHGVKLRLNSEVIRARKPTG